ncbi:MAG: hypothetical protein QXZ19_04220, partial [Thermoplasmata archaeon]
MGELMKGKASMLPANRTLSALVVVCLLVSGFAGFLVLVGPPEAEGQAIGDLIVTGTYVIEGITQPVDGNVVVESGGHLIIRDATLSVISNYDLAHRHSITVNSGGTITLEHGTITTYLDQIDPYPFLTLNVAGGKVFAKGKSVLQFPGQILLTGGATVFLNDTEIKALPAELVQQYVVGSGGLISADEADDGPAIQVVNSKLNLFDSAIADLPEYPVKNQLASNLTLSGTSSLLAVNSHISVDFGPVITLADWFTHNSMVVTGSSLANLYGCTFDPYVGDPADRVAAIVTTGDADVAVPSGVGAGDTTVGQDYRSLVVAGESWTYHVGPGQRMVIGSFDAGAPSTISSARLIVRYAVTGGYNGNAFVMWNLEGNPPASTGIRPLATETS